MDYIKPFIVRQCAYSMTFILFFRSLVTMSQWQSMLKKLFAINMHLL